MNLAAFHQRRFETLAKFVASIACGSEAKTETGEHACVYKYGDPVLERRCKEAREVLAKVEWKG